MNYRTPLSDLEKAIAQKVSSASMPPATACKRFSRNLREGYIKELSPRGRRFMAFVVHRFRRQYHLTEEEIRWVNEWIKWTEEPMPEHFTKSTIEAKFWCKKCGCPTMHFVNGGRRGSCQECIKRLENQPKSDSSPEQMSLMEVYGTIKVK